MRKITCKGGVGNAQFSVGKVYFSTKLIKAAKLLDVVVARLV